MKLSVNGEQRELDEGSVLQALIDEMNLEGKRYAVEVNREIVPKREHPEHVLKEGDVVEIVHAVGGG